MATAIAAKRLLEEAHDRRLTADERRLCVAWLQTHEPGITQKGMADRFGVSDAQIRDDIKKNKLALAGEVKQDFQDAIVGDIIHECQNLVAELEQSCKATKLGSSERRMHIMARLDVRMKSIAMLQDIGALPKNLGDVAQKKQVFVTEMQQNTGQMITRPVDLFDDFREGESLEEKLRRTGQTELLGLPANTRNVDGPGEAEPSRHIIEG